MTRWLRITLAAQVVFFALWGAYLLTSHEGAEVVWLATEPVDPRDLLSGHYVALRYRIGEPGNADCMTPMDGPGIAVYVRLEAKGATVVTSEGPVAISEAIGCRTDPPPPTSGGRWITGQLAARGRIAYGIERFYVTETSALREARSGSVVAKVAINERFQPRLVDVVPLLPAE